MKLNKRKIIIISSVSVSVIAILLTLLFTLFGLKLNKVTLQVHQIYEPFMQEEFEQEVVSSTSLKQNMSVFFINKKSIANEIENQFPEVKVINIETVFPNGLVIHVANREGLFALYNQANNKYLILDRDFKVLDIRETFVSTTENEILLNSIEYNNSIIQKGEFVSLGDNGTILINLAKSLLTANRDTTEQKALIKSVDILTDEVREYISNDEKVLQITLNDNFKVLLYSARTKLNEKVALMFSALPEAYPLYNNTHTLEVFEKNDGSLFCKLKIQ